MKKLLLIMIIIPMTVGTAYSKIITEKDIGPCIARNAAGFCSESKTHYCYSFSKNNGRCEVWYDKSKSQNENTLDAFFSYHNAMNEGINKATQEQAKLNKPYNDAMLKEFPRIKEIGKKRVELEQELANLKNKSDLGITVDKDKISLLYFQIDALKELQTQGIRITKPGTIAYEDTTISISSSDSIENDYINSMRNLDNALKAGKISQVEYNEGKNTKLERFKTDYDEIIKLYDKILNLSQTPEEHAYYWLEKNCSQSIQSIENFDTSNIENKVQKFNNVINNTKNSVNSVKGLFGI